MDTPAVDRPLPHPLSVHLALDIWTFSSCGASCVRLFLDVLSHVLLSPCHFLLSKTGDRLSADIAPLFRFFEFSSLILRFPQLDKHDDKNADEIDNSQYVRPCRWLFPPKSFAHHLRHLTEEQTYHLRYWISHSVQGLVKFCSNT